MSNRHNRQEQPVSIANWIGTLVVSWIPLVNIILFLVWAFGSNTPASKSNWAKAELILMIIVYTFVFIGYAAGIVQ